MKKFLLAAIVLFAGAAQMMAQSYDIYVEDATAEPGANVVMPVLGTGDAGLLYGFQCDVVVPEGFAVTKDVRGKDLKAVNDDEEYTYAIGGATQEDGSFRILVYSNPVDGLEPLPAKAELTKMTITTPATEGEYEIKLKNIETTSNDGKKYQTYTEYTCKLTLGDPTGVSNVNAASAVKNVYTVAGAQQNGVKRGVNIVRKQDGTVQKVMVK